MDMRTVECAGARSVKRSASDPSQLDRRGYRFDPTEDLRYPDDRLDNERKKPMPKVLHPHITSDPAVMNGQPCIRGLRLTVRRVLEALATYPDRRNLRAEYPELEDEDIRQALEYAAANLEDKAVDLKPAS